MAGKPWIISKTAVRPLRAALVQPFRTALGDHNTLDNLLFTITLGDGTLGLGEAAIATHITSETVAATKANLRAAEGWLKGQDIREYSRLSVEMHERWGGNPAMIAAVETALFDAFARAMRVPLWKLFGPRCARLRTDITVVVADLEETRKSARDFYRRGFRRFKVKIGRDADLDVRRVLAVHELAGGSEICLDANQGFNADEMLKFLRILRRRGVRPDLLEQPVAREDREGLKKVTQSTDIPVCADESVRDFAEAAAVIKDKAADVINIKVMKFGIVRAVEVARLARACGMELMIGGMLESSVAMTASAHLAAGSGFFRYVDLDTPFFIRGEAERNPYLSKRGVYDLRGVKNGTGITV